MTNPLHLLLSLIIRQVLRLGFVKESGKHDIKYIDKEKNEIEWWRDKLGLLDHGSSWVFLIK